MFAKDRIAEATIVDHDLMKARGGTDERSNLVPMCRACHDAKSLRELGKTPKRRVDRHGNPLDPNDPWHMPITMGGTRK